MALDILDREISVDDHVVFSNAIYRVLNISDATMGRYGAVRIKLYSPSKTTRPVTKFSRHMCIIPTEDFMIWKIKTGN